MSGRKRVMRQTMGGNKRGRLRPARRMRPTALVEAHRSSLISGGQARYEAILALGELDGAGTDVSVLKGELADCIFDPELGTYRRAYWLFGSFVKNGIDLTPELPKLVERAQDYYHGGQELATILCSYAEKSPANAQAVFEAGKAQGIPFEDYEEPCPSEVDYTATASDRMYDERSGPREVIKAPEWFKQICFLAYPPRPAPAVQTRTFRWGKYGVTIGGGKLQWFEEAGGGYSQSYTEFLEEGLKLLWIDRVMPEEIRIKVYAALGAKAPAELSSADRRKQFTDFLQQWKSTARIAAAQCPVCTKIPEKSSRGEDNAIGTWDDMPAEFHALKKLMSNLHRSEIFGCEKCGQLYEFSTYHDNMLGHQENSESLDRLSLSDLGKTWLRDIDDGERIQYY